MVFSVCQTCLENVGDGGMFRSAEQMVERNVGIPSLVMPGLVPGIHALKGHKQFKTWMAGTSPAMTLA